MAEKKNVIFRRVKGRVIPIRVKHGVPKQPRIKQGNATPRSTAAQGFALTGAGLAAGFGGGYLAGRQFKKAVKSKQLAFKFGRERAPFGRGLEGAMFGGEFFKRSERIRKTIPKIGKATRFASIPLVALGVEKLVESTGIEERGGLPAELASETAGAAAGVAAYAGYKKGAGRKIKNAVLAILKRKVKLR